MLDLCPVFKWCPENWTDKPVYGPKCRVFNGLPNHVTLPFEYQTPIMFGIQMYLVFSIQIVTVVGLVT